MLSTLAILSSSKNGISREMNCSKEAVIFNIKGMILILVLSNSAI